MKKQRTQKRQSRNGQSPPVRLPSPSQTPSVLRRPPPTPCYEGRKVRSLTGDNGLAALTETASRYNDEGYSPALSGTKLIFELSSSKRRELDDLCAKSVPDLFAVESEVKP